MRVIVLVLFVGLVALWLYEFVRDASPEARRRSLYSVLTFFLVGVLVLVVVRFGVHWLAVVAAGALALLRRLFPLLIRVFPFASKAYQRRREAKGEPPGSASPRGRRGSMSRSEALEILGLEEGATREQILDAYKSLIKKVHPDVPGGSTRLAQQVNAAKNVLLGD